MGLNILLDPSDFYHMDRNSSNSVHNIFFLCSTEESKYYWFEKHKVV